MDQSDTCDIDTKPACQHCGQPLRGNQQEFCCSGCEMVYSILKDRGLDRYYDLKGSLINDPVEVSEEAFDYLETESFDEIWVKRDVDGTKRVVFYIKGIQCAACVWLIEKVLNQAEGMVSHQLQMGNGKLELRFQDDMDLKRLARELASMGYRLGLQAGPETDDLKRRRREIIRLGVAGALAGNLMMFSLPLYTGGADSSQGTMFAWISFAVSLPVVFFAAYPFLSRAWQSIRHRMFHLDIPIALGVLGGEFLSIYDLAMGHYEGVYFDSIGMLVFFLLAGRFVQSRSVERALDQCKRLMADMPELTEVRRDGEWKRVVSDQLQPGEHLRLRSGEVLPVDAVVLTDVSVWNVQVVTGESLPQRVGKGESVPAGAINMGGNVELESSSDLAQGSLANLERQAEAAMAEFDVTRNSKLAGWFTTVTLLVALTGVILWWDEGPVQAMRVALTIFVVACPCALALARPTSEAFGVLRASELGVWVKTNRFFPRMDEIKQILFDKTGVLTHGELEIVARKDFTTDISWLNSAVCALESHSDHPVAAILTRTLQGEEPASLSHEVEQVEVLPGRGVRGRVDGRDLWIGSWDACRDVFEFELDRTLIQDPFHWDQNLVVVVQDGALAMLLGLKDCPREDVPDLVEYLNSQGLSIYVCSGDRQEIVDRLLNDLPGVEGRGRMMPQDKLSEVRLRTERAPVLMVGDGLNDMGALAAAHIGIAAGNAAPAAVRYCDAVLHGVKISVLNQIIELAKSVKKAIILAIVVSLGYNVTSFYLALIGAIGPLVAAVLMPLSSLSVIGIAAAMIRRKRNSWVS